MTGSNPSREHSPPVGTSGGASGAAPPSLVVQRGVSDLKEIALTKPVLVLGRSVEADIVLNNTNISRKHAQIVIQGERSQIRDLGSTNGTFVNGARVASDGTWLQNGDLVELAQGEVMLTFHEGVAEGDSDESAPGEVAPPAQISPEGTVTILFDDIVGSTAMTEKFGDQKWQELLHIHNTIIRDKISDNQGFEVKNQGDGFMVAFSSARRALLCAIDIQRGFAEYSEKNPAEAIRVRVGLHTGEVIKEGEDFFGKNVILAARISAQATEGEILVSSLLKELTESSGVLEFGDGRDVELKGLSGTYHVYPVVWQVEESYQTQSFKHVD